MGAGPLPQPARGKRDIPPARHLTPGIVAALAIEARTLVSCGAWVVRSGIGPEPAGRAADSLVRAGAGGLISFGLAASLDHDVPAGTLILADEVVTAAGTRTPTDAPWRQRLLDLLGDGLAVRVGALAASPAILTGADAKRELREATGGVVADMESDAIATIATAANIPFIALRAVADTASRTVPGAALAAVGPDGRTRPGAALWALARRPLDLPDMLAIARDGRHAVRSLRRVAARCGPGFGFV